MRAIRLAALALTLFALPHPALGAPAAAPPSAGEWEKPTLHIGDPAPRLTVASWCKGDAIDRFQPGRVYIVEFFATHDGPSRDSFKHLTALQSKFGKHLTVIGVATRTAREGEPVADFVKRMGDRMGYTVAVDDGSAMEKAWVRAVQRFTLPTTFVIDREGKIAWVGNPRTGLNTVVEAVMNNTFDPQKQAALDARFAELEREFTDARHAAEWDRAFAILDEAKRFRPEAAPMVELTRFEVTLTEKLDAPAAYRLAEKIIPGELKDEDRLLRRVAGVIAEHPAVKNRNWDIALAAAEQAVKTTGGKDGWSLGALAEIRFQRGEIDQAIQTQIQAMTLAEGDQQLHPRVSDALERYRVAQAKTRERTVTTVPTGE